VISLFAHLAYAAWVLIATGIVLALTAAWNRELFRPDPRPPRGSRTAVRNPGARRT